MKNGIPSSSRIIVELAGINWSKSSYIVFPFLPFASQQLSLNCCFFCRSRIKFPSTYKLISNRLFWKRILKNTQTISETVSNKCRSIVIFLLSPGALLKLPSLSLPLFFPSFFFLSSNMLRVDVVIMLWIKYMLNVILNLNRIKFPLYTQPLYWIDWHRRKQGGSDLFAFNKTRITFPTL